MNVYKIWIGSLAVALTFGLVACGGGGGGGTPDSDGDGVPNISDSFAADAARFVALETLTDDTPGTTFSVAVAASNDLAPVIVVGQSDQGGTTLIGQRWSLDPSQLDPAVTPQDLDPLAGEIYSAAYGVNAAGLAVGESTANLDVNTVPVYWAAGSGIPTPLSLTVGLDTFTDGAAYGVNDAGQIVGELIRGDGSRMAVLWQPDLGVYGDPVSLPELETGLSATAHAINAAGQIAGESLTAGGMRGALWQVSAAGAVLGNTVNLGTIVGHASSSAFGIDALGQVVGESVAVNGTVRGVRWVMDGAAVSDIVQLGDDTSAMAISAETGRVVGSSLTGAEVRAAIWDNNSVDSTNADAVLSSGPDLYTPSTGSSRAYGMTSSGVVVGLALDRAYVAIPR